MINVGIVSRFQSLLYPIGGISVILLILGIHGCSKKEDTIVREIRSERNELVVLYDSLKASIASMVLIENRLRKEHEAAIGTSKDKEEHIKLEIRHAELIEAARVLLEDDAKLIALHDRLGAAYLRGAMSKNDVLVELESIRNDEKKLIRERQGIEADQGDIIADHEEMMREHASHSSR